MEELEKMFGEDNTTKEPSDTKYKTVLFETPEKNKKTNDLTTIVLYENDLGHFEEVTWTGKTGWSGNREHGEFGQSKDLGER